MAVSKQAAITLVNEIRVLVSATDCSASETRAAKNAAMGSLSETLSGKQKDEDEFPRSARKVNGHWFSVEGNQTPLIQRHWANCFGWGHRKEAEWATLTQSK